MRGERRIRNFLVPIFIMVFSFSSLPGEAANLNILPSLTLEETWDSNIFNARKFTPETSDYIFRARPALTLYLEAFHTTAKITGGFEFEKYADNDQLDETSATNNFDLTVSDPFRITPNFSLHPSASYVETRDSARRNLFSQSESPELSPTEAVVTERSKVREYRASLRITYLLSPNVDLGLGGGGVKRDFVDDVSGTDEEDSQTYTGDASLSYRIAPRLSTGVFVNTSHNTFGTSPDSRSYSGGVSARYLLTQFYTLDVRAGASYFEEDADATGRSNEEWSPYGRVSLTYTWQYFQATFLGSYEIAGGGSFGRATKRGTVRLNLTSQFAEGWWWDLSGYFQNNSATGDQAEEDINTAEGTAGIRYAAAEWASLYLSGKIFRQRSDGLEAGDIDRESVFLGITLSKLYRLY
jgi:hypothetical protein